MNNKTRQKTDCNRAITHTGSSVTMINGNRKWGEIEVTGVTGLGLASAPAQVLVSVRKVTGGLNLFATVRGDSITTGGFTADLSALTDAATYKLDYLVIL